MIPEEEFDLNLQLLADEDDMPGRTVDKVWHEDSDVLFITFTDKSYIILRAESDYGGADLFAASHHALSAIVLMDLGLITRSQYDEYNRRLEKQRLDQAKAYRRNEYNRLRLEFGNEESES